MSTTLLDGVPPSLVASGSNRAFEGKGRPRIVDRAGAWTDDERGTVGLVGAVDDDGPSERLALGHVGRDGNGKFAVTVWDGNRGSLGTEVAVFGEVWVSKRRARLYSDGKIRRWLAWDGPGRSRSSVHTNPRARRVNERAERRGDPSTTMRQTEDNRIASHPVCHRTNETFGQL